MHREFVKQQQNEAGQNGLCNSSSSSSSPKASVPGSKQAYLTTSHHWPSSAPGRSHNISPQRCRGDLSLCRVPAQIRCGAMQKPSSKSVCTGDGSPAPKGAAASLPLGQADVQVHPKSTPASNTASECPLPSLPAPHSPRMGCCPWDRAIMTLSPPALLAVPPKSLPSTATDRGKFDICREMSPCSLLIISRVEADFCSMIQAPGSRECKCGGCFPGKQGLFLLKRAGTEGKVWPGHDPSPCHPSDNARSQDKVPAAQGIPAPGCNVPEQSQACDPTLTHSSLRAAGHQDRKSVV